MEICTSFKSVGEKMKILSLTILIILMLVILLYSIPKRKLKIPNGFLPVKNNIIPLVDSGKIEVRMLKDGTVVWRELIEETNA